MGSKNVNLDQLSCIAEDCTHTHMYIHYKVIIVKKGETALDQSEIETGTFALLITNAEMSQVTPSSYNFEEGTLL